MENAVLTTEEEEEKNSEMAVSVNCSPMAGQKRARLATNISSLPDDIMFDILVRLPAQDIYDTARLVCPSWLKIIRTHDFYRAHIKQSACGLLIQHRRFKYNQTVFVSTQKDQMEISNFSHKRKVLSSCNGLVLDYLDFIKKDLYISNPATKRRFALPHLYANKPPSGFAAMAYSAASMEYKVVHTSIPYINRRGLRCCSVLTVGVDKDWTRFLNTLQLSETAEDLLFSVRPLTTGGFVHWARDKDVLTLNIETEIFTQHHVPSPIRYHDDGEARLLYHYLPMGSHLSMLIGDQNTFSWELWITKPETREWTNVTSIDFEAEKCSFEGVSALNCRLEPVGWLKLEEVLVFRVTKLDSNHNCHFHKCHFAFDDSNHCIATRFCIAYNVCTREINSFELELECHISINHFTHTNSLIWMDRVPFLNEDGESNSNNSDVIRDDLGKREEYLDSLEKSWKEMRKSLEVAHSIE